MSLAFQAHFEISNISLKLLFDKSKRSEPKQRRRKRSLTNDFSVLFQQRAKSNFDITFFGGNNVDIQRRRGEISRYL